MSATLVSSNTTIKVNAAISNASSVSGTTLYTAPANGYAIVNLTLSASAGTTSATVGNRTVFQVAATATGYQQIFIGPSQALQISLATGSGQVSGVEFVNTP
jgi:hypothetical protein